jgi:GTP cyclohydrolase I
VADIDDVDRHMGRVPVVEDGEEELPHESVHARRRAVTSAMANILYFWGLKDAPGMEETPARWMRFFEEFNQPVDLQEMMKAFDHESGSDVGAMVVQSGIPFRGLCEHHLLPFYGTCDLGYIPGSRVVGLSKLTRVVQAAGTSRPSIQERITNQIADAIHKGISALGVIVVTRAEHTCMSVRGVNSPGVKTIVSALRGNFVHVPAARQEFLSLVGDIR